MSIHLGRGRTALVIGAVIASTTLVTAPGPASAAGISDPPTLPHSIIVFPVRDFVSASGYLPGDRPTVEVVRGGFVVGTASNLVPQDDPKSAGFDGLVEVNHPGGGCWEGVTPDIRPNDVIRVLTAPDTGDSTPTSGVTITQPATKTAADVVVVKGTAVSSIGTQIPVDQLEARIVANQQAFQVNDRRTLRASSAGGEGTLRYDGPGLTTWTATFTGLGGVSPVDGLSDADRAVANQTRGLWLGRDAGAGAEGTIYEYGEVGGPAAPCTAPLASGPTVPDMTAATDSGASSSDNTTNNPSPVFRGVTGLPSATVVNLYVDGAANGTAPVGAAGAYTLVPSTPLTDGQHQVTASEVAPGGAETLSSGSLSVTIDTTAAGAPALTGTVPASPGRSAAPSVRGTSVEADSTVTVYSSAGCPTPSVGSGAAASFTSTGIVVAVAPSSTTDFFATATDVAGNVSACSTTSARYTQDGVAPPAPDISAASTSGLVASTTARFLFSDTEATATFECSRDSAAFTPCSSPQDYTALTQGSHTFAVRAMDLAGNTSVASSTSWTVDTVAPSVTISSPVGAVLNDTSPTFRFLASEPGSSVSCSLDGAPSAPCTTSDSQTSSGLIDGPHTFTVTATDPAGNTGTQARYSFTVDTQVPTVSIDSTPPTPTNHNAPSFAFSSNKAGVSFTCAFALASVTTPSFTPCANGTFNSTPRADGAYLFTVRATDPAGNVGSASTTLTIDTLPPGAPTITTRPAGLTNVNTPSFGFTSPDPGAAFICSLAPGSPAGPCSTGEPYGPLVDGAYVFKVQARDQAGNLGVAASASFTIDTATPTLSINSGPQGLVASASASFGFSSADTTAKFECAMDTAAFAACTSPKAYAALSNGDHTFQVRAKDGAGNVSSPVSRSFTVDATRPVVTVVSAPAALSQDTSPVFGFSTSETAATSCSLVLATAVDSFTGCTSPTAFSGLPDGRYRFAVKAVDPAGNTSAVVTRTFVIDTTAPGVAITGKPTVASPTTTPTFTFFTESTATTHCSLQASGTPTNLVPCTSPTTYGPLADGIYTFAVNATDAAGNTSIPRTYNFTVDTIKPTLSTKVPAANALNASQTANITALLSENVTGVDSTSFTLTSAGAAVPATVTYATTTRLATLNPTATLAADTRYTATTTSTIKDAAGNALALTSWTFVTGPAPTAVTNPASNATGVLQTGNLTATFNEAVSGVTGASFKVTTPTGSAVAATVSYAPTTRVATLDPTAVLAADTTYTATLTSAVRDTAGNPLTTKVWKFTTGPRPTLTATSPTANKTAVTRLGNVTATFSENVRGITGTTFVLKNTLTGAQIAAVVSYSTTTRVATLNPSATLTANTKYTATIGAGITDTAGNTFSARTWSFTTGP